MPNLIVEMKTSGATRSALTSKKQVVNFLPSLLYSANVQMKMQIF